MKPNPITQYLTRNHRWPSLLGAVLIALGVCVVSLGAYAFGIDPDGQVAWNTTWILLAINPLVIAVLSPVLTRKMLRDESHQLRKLAPLSLGEIQQGLVQTVLFRVRLQIAVQIGLQPAWSVIHYHDWVDLATAWQLDSINIAAAPVIVALTWFSLFGLNLLAAIFGVRQGLRSSSSAHNIALSLGRVVLIPAVCYYPILRSLGTLINDLPWDSLTAIAMISTAFVVLILLPYGLAVALYVPVKKNG